MKMRKMLLLKIFVTTAILINYPYIVLIICILTSLVTPSSVPQLDRPALGVRVIFLASSLIILRAIIRRLCFSMHIAISFLSETHELFPPSKIAALALLGLILMFPNFQKKIVSERCKVYPTGSC
jgi:hypothetical protein